MPRVDPADDLAGREDRPTAQKTIGLEGANRLTALALEKKVTLAKYLEPIIGRFGHCEDLTAEQARHIWKQLHALPENNGTTHKS